MTNDRHFNGNESFSSPSSQRQEPPLLSVETPFDEENNNSNNGVRYPDDPLQGIDDGAPKDRLSDLCAAIFSRETEADFKTNSKDSAHIVADDLGPTADVVRSSTLDVSQEPPFPVQVVGNSGPEMNASYARTKNHATVSPFRSSSRQVHGESPVSSTSPRIEHHYTHLPPPPTYHPWSPQPYLFFNGGHPMPPPHHHHPYPFHHHHDAYRSMYEQPMECEVFDVDNDIVVTEQQPSPSRREGVPPSLKMRSSFMSGGFAPNLPGGGYYPSSDEFEPIMASPYQPLAAMRTSARPADSNQVPEGLKTGSAPGTHRPVLIQTGLGPALLLRPSAMAGHVPVALPRSTDKHAGTSEASSSVDGSVSTRNNTKATKKTSSAPVAATTTEVEVMDTRFQRWTEAEDQLLTKAAKEQGGPPYNWNRIAAKCFPSTRTGPQCKARWKKALKPGLKRGNWEPEEDRLILELHEEGLRWTEIAERIPGRVPDHIRQRFMNALDPQKKKTPWTQQENKVLYQAQKQLGNKWSEISKLLPGRSENDIKNRWHNAKMAQRRKMRRIAKESARRTVVSKTTLVQPPATSGVSLDGSSESRELLQVDDDDDSIGSLS